MGRNKQKNWARISCSVSEDAKKALNIMAGREGVSNSEFIDMIILRNYELSNPMEEVREIRKKKEDLNQEIEKLNKQESVALNNVETHNKLLNEKKKKKDEAIKTIIRMYEKYGITHAETVSKNWSQMTGIPANELLHEAVNKIEKGV